MPILLLDNTVTVDIFYDPDDREFDDNICFRLVEDCEDEEKILIHDETNIYLTADQARQLAEALLSAVADCRTSGDCLK